MVPDRLSEVFGDVLELACGGGGSDGDKATGSTSNRIGMVTGVAIIRDRWVQRTSRSSLSSASTNSTDSIGPTTSSEELNVTKERQAVQSSSSTAGLGSQMLARNPSVSSQNSLEKSINQSTQRGSSPQIKTFDPDGRYHYQDCSRTASSYPPTKSRSPSPSANAVFLEPRSGSPAGCENHHSGIILPLSSLEIGASSSGAPSIKIANRCLSPLLIPSPRSSISDESPAPPASPLGALQPDLYHRQDGPLFLSARSPGSKSGKNMGRLHLRLSYDFDKSDLHVHLIEALDLTGSDQGGFNDPFVKLTLSPEVDNRKRQTRIHKNDRNPCFDQHFKFPVSFEELQEKILVLQVFDFDRYSRNNVVGSVRVAMNELKLVTSTSSVEVWGEIAREKKPPEEIQEILVSLSYLPSAERLTVLILKARNLFPLQDKETLDPFVKVSLLSGEKRVKKKKTVVKKATRNPVWNEAMSFDVPSSCLATSAIEVCVLDGSGEMGGNAMVGSCIVGPAYLGHSSEAAIERGNPSRDHWTQVTQSPRKGIAMWHTLH